MQRILSRQDSVHPDRVPPPARPTRILVVEDERHIARFLVYMLTGKGYQVQAVHDGEAALSAAESFKPDGVLLDLLIPKLSGQEVLGRLRADRRFSGMKILLLTGCPTTENDMEAPAGTGADACCLKPIGPSALLEMLKQHGLPSKIAVQAGSEPA